VANEDADRVLMRIGGPRLVLFLGSSIGNYEAPEDARLLARLRRAMRSGDGLLLGTDLRKAPSILLSAYDDAAGVTAAFDLNVLAHVNRRLDATFDLSRFRHLARWNEGASRIEMHLESLAPQQVAIGALRRTFTFARGETIHTESSVKYTVAAVDALLHAAGFRRARSFFDGRRWCAVHLAVPVSSAS
jgi:L-histidine N-alpha-methyltransferase